MVQVEGFLLLGRLASWASGEGLEAEWDEQTQGDREPVGLRIQPLPEAA